MRRFTDRLTILQKILLTSAIFALPIIVLLYFMVSGFNRDIRFTRLELAGSSVLVPLHGLAELLSEHQLLARLQIQGDKTMEQRVHEVGWEIEKRFTALQKTGKQWEGPLLVTEKALKAEGLEGAGIARLQKDWQELRADWKDDTASRCDERHMNIRQRIGALSTRVGNTSNMVLDSGLDTYYLVEGVFTMSRGQERLSDFLLFAESVIYKGFRSQQDVNQLSTFAALLEGDRDSVKRSLEAALQENKKLHGAQAIQKSIPPLLEQYESALLSFLVVVRVWTNDPQYKPTVQEFLPPAKELATANSKLREASMMELQALLNGRADSQSRTRGMALLLSLCTLAVACSAVLFISRGITRSLNGVIDIAGEIAEGNLQKAMDGLGAIGASSHLGTVASPGAPENARNEIARLFSAIATMTGSLHSLLGQVGKSGIQVTTSSSEIAASARELEATVAEQASSINEVSATSREISATSQEFAGTMKKVSGMAATAAELANSSMASLSDINSTMKRLLESTSRSSAKLQMVNEKMENITQVITTITKIANQINLLSLNAAIEAEKAGEQGIGFSVVAREIRRLADQTAVATLDIEAMIVEAQDAVKDGVDAVDAYTHETRASTESIAGISVDLLRAIEHTRELVPQFETINEGMQMQVASAAHISEAMEQLNQAAKQTRDSLADFRKVTEQLNEAVSDLQHEVARFSVTGVDS